MIRNKKTGVESPALPMAVPVWFRGRDVGCLGFRRGWSIIAHHHLIALSSHVYLLLRCRCFDIWAPSLYGRNQVPSQTSTQHHNRSSEDRQQQQYKHYNHRQVKRRLPPIARRNLPWEPNLPLLGARIGFHAGPLWFIGIIAGLDGESVINGLSWTERFIVVFDILLLLIP